jgi:hypothetical protein
MLHVAFCCRLLVRWHMPPSYDDILLVLLAALCRNIWKQLYRLNILYIFLILKNLFLEYVTTDLGQKIPNTRFVELAEVWMLTIVVNN